MIIVIIILILLYIYIKTIIYATEHDATGYHRRKEYEKKKLEKERTNKYE